MVDDYPSRLLIEGTGDAVVLVPGMDGTGLLFHRQRPLLMRSRRVATYALRDSASDMPTLVSDLAGVIETVAPVERRAIVIGESFGGTLAMSLALERPERVAALVVLNSFAHFTPQVRLHLARWGLRALPWGMMPLVRRATAARLHSAHTHADEVRQFMRVTMSATREGYLNRLAILTRYDIRERLHELRMPTLFVASELDHLVPSVTQANFMAARVPGATVRVLDGHGHICLIAPGVDLAQILDEWASNAQTQAPKAQSVESKAQSL
jgi:pimeloyl-ACP methyl ester carboxylesterase